MISLGPLSVILLGPLIVTKSSLGRAQRRAAVRQSRPAAQGLAGQVDRPRRRSSPGWLRRGEFAADAAPASYFIAWRLNIFQITLATSKPSELP